MTSNLFEGFEELIAGAGVPFMLSLVASIARCVRYGWRSLRHLLVSVTTSIFIGQVVFWGLSWWPDMSMQIKAAIVSLSAYMGGSLLDAVFFRVKKEIREGGRILHRPPERPQD